MNELELTVALPGDRHAVLKVPEPLTPETLHTVEQALSGALGCMRRELDGGGADEGAREYESWIRQLNASRSGT